MREILFRGKRVDNGEWVEGYYVHLDAGKMWSHRIYTGYAEVDVGDFYPDFFEVDPSTVGQSTGLLDINGKRIFEGDILSDPERPKYTTGAIYYGECNCSCCDGVYGFYSKESADLRDAAWLTVIGNIHDNPELLEVSENG